MLRRRQALVETCQDPLARAEFVHRATLDQTLDHALVERAKVNPMAEIVERGKSAVRLPLGNHAFDRSFADVFHSGKPVADAELQLQRAVGDSLDREAALTVIDARREQIDAEPPALSYR